MTLQYIASKFDLDPMHGLQPPAMTDDFEDPPNDIPDEPPPGAPTTVPDPQFPDEDAIDGSEDDATTTPEDPQ